MKVSEPALTAEAILYNAFISYSNRVDYRHAKSLEEFLEAVDEDIHTKGRVKEKLQICRDGSDFHLPYSKKEEGGELPEGIWPIIEQHLEQSEYLLLLCSPSAAQSKWVTKEIEWFIRHRGAHKIILAVTVGDPDDAASTFPEIIRNHNLHNRQIWYDLRGYAGSDFFQARNYKEERARLAARLLGWDIKEHGTFLAQLQRADRQRRLRSWSVGFVIALLAITVAFLGIERIEIDTQRELIEIIQDKGVHVDSEQVDSLGYRLVFPDLFTVKNIFEVVDLASQLGDVYSLNLSDTYANDQVVHYIATVLPEIKKLNLNETAVTDNGVLTLRSLPNIESLELAQTQVTNISLQVFSTLKNLSFLSLKATGVTGVKMPEEYYLEKLEILRLDDTKLAGEDLTFLRAFPNLVSLNLSGTSIDPQILTALEELDSLERLYLNRNALEDDDLLYLKGITDLTDLHLYNNRIRGAGLSHLKDLQQLKVIILNSNPIQGAALGVLSEFPQLQRVNIRNAELDATGTAQLARIGELKELFITGNPIGDKGLQNLCTMNSIEVLDVRSTEITEQGVKCLENMGSLLTLYMNSNEITDSSITALSRIPLLQHAYLMGTDISAQGITELKQMRSGLKIDSNYD